jgi:hypothetical protein
VCVCVCVNVVSDRRGGYWCEEDYVVSVLRLVM